MTKSPQEISKARLSVCENMYRVLKKGHSEERDFLFTIESISEHIRQICAEEIMPRFRNLRTDENMTKTGGDAVTAADLETEKRLSPVLCSLLPGSVVIGEEACEDNPNLLSRISEDGPVWVVDPVDGTTHFAQGEAPFGVMVALLKQGVPVASWIYMPLDEEIYTAEAGSGVFRNSEQITFSGDEQGSFMASELIVTLKTGKLPADLQQTVEHNIHHFKSNIAGRLCAAADYTEILTGKLDASFYYRTLPWDHVPGTLMIREAGGVVLDFQKQHKSASQMSGGLLAARSEQIARIVHETVFTDR